MSHPNESSVSIFENVSKPSIQTNSQTIDQTPIVTATPPATPLKSALKQSTPPMTQQPTQEAQAAKPWAPKPVVAPQSKVPQSQETLSDLTGSNVGQSSFMAQNKGMSLLVYRSGILGRTSSIRDVRTIHFILVFEHFI